MNKKKNKKEKSIMEKRWEIQKQKFNKEHKNVIQRKYTKDKKRIEELECMFDEEKISAKKGPDGKKISISMEIPKCTAKQPTVI